MEGLGGMKRYRVKLFDKTQFNQMVESPNGEWVKWEGVENLINDHMTPMEIRMMGLLQSRLLNQTSAKCNCEENYNKGLETWVCPAHGYKRR